MPFTVEDLALTSLVRILPRSRYRLAGQTDARFQSFAGNTTRIAYRQQGPTPAFLLYSGPGQDPHAAALAAASWAEANWRPNAIQRKVRQGVVVVHVAPGSGLTAAGPVAGAAVPAAVWTVDSETGRVVVAGSPPGSPSGGDVKRAALALLGGMPAPSLGELDRAERNVMQVRTIGSPRILTGAISICVLLIVLQFAFGGVMSLGRMPSLIASGNATAIAGGVVSVLLLAGLVFGIAVLFNFFNLAFRTPGFSSPVQRTRNLAWGGFAAVMIGLLFVQEGVLPATYQASPAARGGESLHVTATTLDDGGETLVGTGGELTVDLTGWPTNEWAGVSFKSSNPSVLELEADPTASPASRPVARFKALSDGVARVDATSHDGRYTFELRVDVGTP